jgi:hypothetical protein
MGVPDFRQVLVSENLQPALQNVHQIAKADRSPEALALGVCARDPNFAALDAPLFDPDERALGQGATHPSATLLRAHHQIRDLGALDFDLDGGGAVDSGGTKAQQGTIALADEDRRVGIAESRREQALDLCTRVGTQGKERVHGRVMLGERNPEGRDPIEIAWLRAANAPAISFRDRGLPQLASW